MSNLVTFACGGSIALETKGSDPHRRTRVGQASQCPRGGAGRSHCGEREVDWTGYFRKLHICIYFNPDAAYLIEYALARGCVPNSFPVQGARQILSVDVTQSCKESGGAYQAVANRRPDGAPLRIRTSPSLDVTSAKPDFDI